MNATDRLTALSAFTAIRNHFLSMNRSFITSSIVFLAFVAPLLVECCDAQQYSHPSKIQQPVPLRTAVQSVQSYWPQHIGTPENRHHDFGVVPYQSHQEHVFEFENPFDFPIHLIGIRTSCVCTAPSITTPSVAPGEFGSVRAIFDTKGKSGQKKATITVSIRKDHPYTQYGELLFSVAGTIRRDVVLDPGQVSFDDVTFGQDAKRVIKLLYAGNVEWRIKELHSSNPNLTVSATETQRNPQTGRIDYDLTLELNASQSVGPFADQISITTNDVNNKNITIHVQGTVKAVVQVSPIRLGVLELGQKVERRLIVRGVRPFELKGVKAGDNRIHFSPVPGTKTLHTVPYIVDTSRLGPIVSEILIETGDPDQQSTVVSFEAQVVSETFAKGYNQPDQE